MPSFDLPSLTPDEIDDLLYFTRVNEAEDLQENIRELAEKYDCPEKDVIVAGTDPDSGNTLLHFCSANGFADLLKALLLQLGVHSGVENSTNGAPATSPVVNAANKEGNTPLHWASVNGHLTVVKILVDVGAEMSNRNSAGHLAVFEAERAGKGEVVEYLLEKGGLNLTAEDLADVPNEDPDATNGVHQANVNNDVNMGG